MPCDLLCPACGRGYYTAASYEEAIGAVCDVCPSRELVPVHRAAAGGLEHLPAPKCVDLELVPDNRYGL